jgi:hypothetical protein
MNESQAFGAIWAVGALVLVGSALVIRRVPARQLALLALAWAGIFVAAVAIARLAGIG